MSSIASISTLENYTNMDEIKKIELSYVQLVNFGIFWQFYY